MFAYETESVLNSLLLIEFNINYKLLMSQWVFIIVTIERSEELFSLASSSLWNHYLSVHSLLFIHILPFSFLTLVLQCRGWEKKKKENSSAPPPPHIALTSVLLPSLTTPLPRVLSTHLPL